MRFSQIQGVIKIVNYDEGFDWFCWGFVFIYELIIGVRGIGYFGLYVYFCGYLKKEE